MADSAPHETWEHLLALRAAMARCYEPEVDAAIQASGIAGRVLGMVFHANDAAPVPLTVAGLLRCVPYYAAEAFAARMREAASDGWLVATDDGYHLSPAGTAAVARIEAAAHAGLATLVPPTTEGQWVDLASLLTRLVQAARTSTEAGDCGCLESTGNARARETPTTAAAVVQAIDTLEAFRCDAHRSIWRRLVLDGRAWELLTIMWQGQANSAESMAAWSNRQGFPRGFSAEDYASDLRTLRTRGLVEPAVEFGAFRLSERGQRLRQEAEDATDAAFYAPWGRLSGGEVARMSELAQALSAGLTGS